ncbi:peptidase M20 [Brevundimonas sp.]|jgi:acetylornithine deacetylase/succinyl-diaminopimelate desuccinylase-like protein|uniref:peptidase M20 n=1 Tax=Brevundimonas sp. TaxID=1871086 RepID=UPI0037C0167A
MSDAVLPFSLNQFSAADIAAIDAAIDRDELVRRVLELCNIPSPTRREREAGQYVFDWMAEEGFAPEKVALVEDRFNVVGRFGGEGDGPNLLFSSHLDTESPFYEPVDRHTYRPETLADPQWLQAWLEDEVFFGYAVGNDRGPMVCFIMAAKALKAAGFKLSGSLYLTACPGEIGPEPVDEHQGVASLGKELGAAYMLAHGGVAPDFAISAEGTDFGLNWAACGYAYYKITVYGEALFTPILDHETQTARLNPIVRMGGVIEAVNAWARTYEKTHAYESEGGGTVTPKVQICAIRGGNPQSIGASSEVCSIYLDVNMGPLQTIGAVDRELKAVLRAAGFEDCEVRPYVFRAGAEADPVAVQPLKAALDKAHASVRGGPMPVGHTVYSSMWRDHNVFNLNRIPSVTMGPVRWRPSVDDLVACTRIYALATLALCGRVA